MSTVQRNFLTGRKSQIEIGLKKGMQAVCLAVCPGSPGETGQAHRSGLEAGDWQRWVSFLDLRVSFLDLSRPMGVGVLRAEGTEERWGGAQENWGWGTLTTE